MLGAGALSSLMDCIRACFDFDADSEITIEANPCDLTMEKISALRNMGFNRVSLGVQSFDDRTLSFLGRKHRAEHNKKAFHDLRSSGFENISMDIIYGFQGQSIRDLVNTLRKAISFQPEHLSCYQLTIEKKTQFWKLRKEGISPGLSEEDESSFFSAVSQFLEDNGYTHYEISNFSLEDIYRSRHNLKYWQHIPYLGLGPSAHSFHESKRWWNVRSVRQYCTELEHGKVPVEGSEKLTNGQLEFESIVLGLRTKSGFDKSRIADTNQSREMLSGFQNSGFLNIENGKVAPTRKGFLVADYLATCLGDVSYVK